jgi:uncharacterized protein
MPKREEVIRILSQHLPELKQKYPIQSLALFGSVARNEATENSDLDLLVEFNGAIGYFGLGRLEDELCELMGCKVDLVTATGLKKRQFRERILSEAIYA